MLLVIIPNFRTARFESILSHRTSHGCANSECLEAEKPE